MNKGKKSIEWPFAWRKPKEESRGAQTGCFTFRGKAREGALAGTGTMSYRGGSRGLRWRDEAHCTVLSSSKVKAAWAPGRGQGGPQTQCVVGTERGSGWSWQSKLKRPVNDPANTLASGALTGSFSSPSSATQSPMICANSGSHSSQNLFDCWGILTLSHLCGFLSSVHSPHLTIHPLSLPFWSSLEDTVHQCLYGKCPQLHWRNILRWWRMGNHLNTNHQGNEYYEVYSYNDWTLCGYNMVIFQKHIIE